MSRPGAASSHSKELQQVLSIGSFDSLHRCSISYPITYIILPYLNDVIGCANSVERNYIVRFAIVKDPYWMDESDVQNVK